jgi:large subunit ribosomal protein L25
MVKKISLRAFARDKVGQKSQQVREEGYIPAVMYGKGEEAKNLKVKYDEFQKVYAEAGESSLVDLQTDSEEPTKALIKDIQRDPVKGFIIHADIYKVNMKEKLEVEVPLTFINEEESPAVRERGGMITRGTDSLYIRCLPNDLPEHVEVDLMQVKDFEDAIRVKDLDLGADIEVLNDPEEFIAGAEEIREEIEEEKPVAEEGEAAEGKDVSEDEEKKKAEEEGQ